MISQNITGKINYIILISLIILNALDSFPPKNRKTGVGFEKAEIAQNKRSRKHPRVWVQLCVMQPIPKITQKGDGDCEMANFASKHHLSLHTLGAEPHKILLSFYSHPQRCQKWGQLLHSCERLPVALAWWKGRGAPTGWRKTHPFFSDNLSAFPPTDIPEALKSIPNQLQEHLAGWLEQD